MNIKIICTLNYIPVSAVISVAIYFGVAADNSDCHFELNKIFFKYSYM